MKGGDSFLSYSISGIECILATEAGTIEHSFQKKTETQISSVLLLI